MKKQSFVFYSDWFEFLKDEPDDYRLMMYDTIAKYAFEGIEPDDSIKREFKLIRARLDKDTDKYSDKIEKRREAGKKHTGNQYTRAKENGTNGTSDSNGTNGTTGTLGTDMLCNGMLCYDNNKIISSTKAEDTLQSADSNASISYEALIKYWNDLVKDKAMHKIVSIEGKRRVQVIARIKKYGKEQFALGLRKAAASSFLNGGGSKDAVFNFDWIIKPNNFPKVLEGNYDDDKSELTRKVHPLNTDWSRQTKEATQASERGKGCMRSGDYQANKEQIMEEYLRLKQSK